jgi:insulysin
LSATSTSNSLGSSAPAQQPSIPIAKDKAPLHSALDRFTQFFIQPLFLDDALDRKLCTMESEYKKKKQSNA